MTKQNFDINKLRVAAPCSASWETMTGDERVRHCHSCQLNIYNISEMTGNEIEDLIVNREGRVCIRLYKRADGTVLTKDCPIGVRAYQKKAARFAGAALAAVLGLFSVSFGQKAEKTIDASSIEITKTLNQNQGSVLTLTILDSAGATIPDVDLKLYKKGLRKKAIKIYTEKDENYTFESLTPGIYILETSKTGFRRYKLINLEIKKDESSKLEIVLEVSNENVTVGIYGDDSSIDVTSSAVQTTITQRMIDKIPH